MKLSLSASVSVISSLTFPPPIIFLNCGLLASSCMKYAGERGIYKAPLCMQLVIPLEKQRGPLFRRVYLDLREAILSGTLGAGEQLPSTRQLAEQLGISRTVVLLAYEHLLAEGFAEGRHGSGTYVSRSVSTASSRAPQEQAELRMSLFGRSAAATGALAGVSPRRLPQFAT